MIIDELIERSKSKTNLLSPKVKEAAEQLIHNCLKRGVHILIKESVITQAQQEALYALGRSKPGKIVTSFRGGESYHQYGMGIDIALLMPNGNTVAFSETTDWDVDGYEDYKEVVIEARKLGFVWGGDFDNTLVKERWHFEMPLLPIKDLQTGKRPTPYTPDIPPIPTQNVKCQVKGKAITANGFVSQGKYYVPVYAIAKEAAKKCGTSLKGNAIVDSVELSTTWMVGHTTFARAEELAYAMGMRAVIDRNIPMVNISTF